MPDLLERMDWRLKENLLTPHGMHLQQRKWRRPSEEIATTTLTFTETLLIIVDQMENRTGKLTLHCRYQIT